MQEELLRAAHAGADRKWAMGSIERHAFYERARRGYAVVVAMGERRPYGCFVLDQGRHRPGWQSCLTAEWLEVPAARQAALAPEHDGVKTVGSGTGVHDPRGKPC